MKNLLVVTHKSRIFCLLLIFLLSFLVFYPSFFFSIDELSYYSRAIAFSIREKDLYQYTINGSKFIWNDTNYPLGTSFLLGLFAVFSSKLSFLSGGVYVFLSLYLLYLSLRKLNLVHTLPFIVFLFSPCLIFFSRGFMSEMPSLLLIAFYLYLIVCTQNNSRKYFILGFIATISILFRETNVLICFGLICISIWQNYKDLIIYGIGCLVGLIPRLLTGYYFYGTLFYVKGNSSFNFSYAYENFMLYTFILLVIFPAGLYILYKYSGWRSTEVKLTLLFFVLVHLIYGYNAGVLSGKAVAIFYNGRFFIPTLPLWGLVYAEFGLKSKLFNRGQVLSVLSILLGVYVLVLHGAFYYLGSKHQAVASTIFQKYNDEIIVYDNSAYRYLNPSQGKINKMAQVSELEVLDQTAFLVLANRNNTNEQLKTFQSSLEAISNKKKIELEEKYEIFDGTIVSIYRID